MGSESDFHGYKRAHWWYSVPFIVDERNSFSVAFFKARGRFPPPSNRLLLSLIQTYKTPGLSKWYPVMLLALTSKLGSRFRVSACLSCRCSTVEGARNNTPTTDISWNHISLQQAVKHCCSKTVWTQLQLSYPSTFLMDTNDSWKCR